MFTRRSLLTMAGLAVALAGASAMALDTDKGANKKVKIGEKVPAFTATDTEGKEHTLADFEGKILVLEWINPDCPYCVDIYKRGVVKQTVEELKKIDSDVEYVTVNSTHTQGPEVSRNWLEKHELGDLTALVDQDGTLGKQFDARTTPHIYVIDDKGVLRYQGAFSNDPLEKASKQGEEVTNYVVQAVQQIKAGETVSPDYVKPWGCGVKYKTGEGSSAGKRPAAPSRNN